MHVKYSQRLRMSTLHRAHINTPSFCVDFLLVSQYIKIICGSHTAWRSNFSRRELSAAHGKNKHTQRNPDPEEYKKYEKESNVIVALNFNITMCGGGFI